MIDRGGNAKIMDFGIARAVKGKGITGPGVMIGTPQYMSPEQVEGKEVDQRSDIYSLGIILYEMLTDRVPFEGDTPLTVGVKQKTETPKEPKDFNERIPDDLNRLIMKCLEKENEYRYQGAEELKSDLDRLEQGLPTTERAEPKTKPLTSREITVQFNLKKILIPACLVAALVIASIFIWNPWRAEVSDPVQPKKPSIAVLPFEDLSFQKDQEFFCDGLAISIMNSLSGIKDLSVRARGSSFSFKGKGLDLQEIGKQLNVDTILDGNVQIEGNRLRFTVQLNNVSDASLLWSRQFNQELADAFDIQDAITLAIIENLQIELLGRERAQLMKRQTENIQAFTLYSKGLFYWNKRTAEGLERAIDYFGQAIKEDANYALAYVGLADCYNLLNYYGDVSPDECFPKAREAAIKALELDDTLGEAHTSLAYYLERYEWDFLGAEREFKRAIELNPNYATAHFWYGELLQIARRFDEAVEATEIALDLDPVSLIINCQLGWAYANAGKHEQAIAQIKKTLEMNPDFAQAHSVLGIVYIRQNRYPEAITEFLTANELSGNSSLYLSYLGYTYAKAHQYDEANKILEELEANSTRKYVNPYYFALIHVGLGENEKALNLLEKAYEERDEFLVWLNSDELSSWFAPLVPHPRYQELLKKIGFKE
jgi:serine/threonine-protein kinase